MNPIVSLATLLSFAFAAEFYPEYTEPFPVGHPLVLCGHIGSLASVFSRVELPVWDNANYFTVSSSKDYYHYGKGFKWIYRPDGRISLITEPKKYCHVAKADELLFLRAKLLPNGHYRLTMADEEEVLAPGDLETFSIRCKPGTTECIVQLEGVAVPYRNDHNDQRPLVLDMENDTGSGNFGRLQLWPANNGPKQVFNLNIVDVEESV